jgi:hypothetical protein
VSEATVEAIIDGGGLRVVFSRVGDRIAHAIDWLDTTEFSPLLESIEGAPDEEWPASPPLQSLHLEERPDGRTLALLVGMAGRSHWSVSLDVNRAAAEVICDVACRAHAEPVRLGSSYRTIDADLLPIKHDTLHLASGSCRLEVRSVFADGQDCRLELPQAGWLTFRSESKPGTLPRTVRWRYTLTRLS